MTTNPMIETHTVEMITMSNDGVTTYPVTARMRTLRIGDRRLTMFEAKQLPRLDHRYGQELWMIEPIGRVRTGTPVKDARDGSYCDGPAELEIIGTYTQSDWVDGIAEGDLVIYEIGCVSDYHDPDIRDVVDDPEMRRQEIRTLRMLPLIILPETA